VNADPKLIGVPVRIEGPNLATLRRLSDFSGMHGRPPPQAVAASRSVKSAHTRPYAAGLNCQVVARHQNLEVIMTLAKISLASAAAITIISWGALAQENQNTGRITQFNHINGKITLSTCASRNCWRSRRIFPRRRVQNTRRRRVQRLARRRRSGLHRSPDWRRLDDHENSKEIIKSETGDWF